jgi:hypothetical protein
MKRYVARAAKLTNARKEKGYQLFKSTRFLPEETLPGRECSCFEQGMLEDCFHTTQRLDDIGSVGVQIPQFSIMPLAGPPEWITFHQLVSLKFGTCSEALEC